MRKFLTSGRRRYALLLFVAAASLVLMGNQCAPTPVPITDDVSVTVTDDPDPVGASGILTYTITVANLGTSDAQNVSLVDHLSPVAAIPFVAVTPDPAFTCATSQSPDATTVTCNASALPSGATATVTLEGRVFPDLPPGTLFDMATIFNTANVATTSSDQIPANNTADEVTTVTN